MPCLDENTLLAFFEGRLDEAARRGVDEHLAGCATCRRLLAEYAQMAAPVDATEPGALEPSRATEVPESSGGALDMGRRVARAIAEKRVGSVLCQKWRIDRLVAIGGMAQVYAATHRNGRRVAVKMLRPELAVEPQFVERFLREGYVANKVEHPGAVAILDDDMAPDGSPFLVMEMLEGRTLRERLAVSGPLPIHDALRVTQEILDVLAAAHDRGIVHRDIKPDNLFETREGIVKVLDFGIARLRERAFGVGSDTQTGTTMGTIGYMAPEQARGQSTEVDARSDLWAVGATLYTLVTGEVLHEAETTNESLLLAMTAPVPPIQELAPGLPGSVAALLDTALAYDKAARFKDCRAMADALVAARRAGDLGSLPPGPPKVSSTGTLLHPMQREGTLLGLYASETAARTAAAPELRGDARRGEGSRGKWALVGLAGLLVGGVGVGFGVRAGARAQPTPAIAAAPPVPPSPAPATPSAAPSEAPSAISTVIADSTADAPTATSSPAPARPTAAGKGPSSVHPSPKRTAASPDSGGTPVRLDSAPSLDPLGPRK